jgi:hypothetical protein
MGLEDRFWNAKGEELRDRVLSEAEKIFDNQASRREAYLRRTQLFENLSLSSPDAAGYLDGTTELDHGDDLRLLRSAIQTARAEIFSPQQPKGQIMTNGASWELRRIARRLDKIHEGLLGLPTQDGYANVWDAMNNGVGMSELIHGMGVLEETLDEDEIVQRCVRECDVYFDPSEGKNVRTLYVIEPIELTYAQEKYPDFAEELEDAAPFDEFSSNHPSSISRVIKQIRVWHLGTKKEPGTYAKIIGNVLIEEDHEFEAPVFPFVFVHWEKHRESPYGMGLLDEGQRLAWDATDLRNRLLTRARIAAGKRVYYKENSLNEDELKSNDEEVHIKVRGNAEYPMETAVPPFNAAEPQFADLVTRGFWDGIGISQVSAAARREAGMETGVALRTLNNTKRGRQLDKAQTFELAFVQIARQHTYRVQELAKKYPNKELKWPGASGFNSQKVSEAILGDDNWEFGATLAPASAFTNSPAGRRSMIAELFSQQVINPAAYEAMLQWPDMEANSHNIINVENEYVDSIIDKLLDAQQKNWDDGDYTMPEPFMQDVPGALLRTCSAYYKAKMNKAPEFNQELLYRFIRDLGDIMNKKAAAASGTAAAIKFASPQERDVIQQSAQMSPAATPPPVA